MPVLVRGEQRMRGSRGHITCVMCRKVVPCSEVFSEYTRTRYFLVFTVFQEHSMQVKFNNVKGKDFLKSKLSENDGRRKLENSFPEKTEADPHHP